MSDILAIRASHNGRLQLSISTDSVTVDTQWTNCTNPKMGGSRLCLPRTTDSNGTQSHLNRKTTGMNQMINQILTTYLPSLSLFVVSSSS